MTGDWDADRASLSKQGAERVRPEILGRLRAAYGDASVDAQLVSLARHGDVIDDAELWLSASLRGNFKFKAIAEVVGCRCGRGEGVLLSVLVFWTLVGVRRCRRWGLIFLAPRLTAAEIDRGLNEFYFDHKNPEFWGRRRLP